MEMERGLVLVEMERALVETNLRGQHLDLDLVYTLIPKMQCHIPHASYFLMQMVLAQELVLVEMVQELVLVEARLCLPHAHHHLCLVCISLARHCRASLETRGKNLSDFPEVGRALLAPPTLLTRRFPGKL